MAEILAIVGDPGTGKSYSLQNLDPEETLVIAVANKTLPFAGSRSMYVRGKNYFYPNMPDKSGNPIPTEKLIQFVYKKATENPDIKQVVIDDARYLMSFKFMDVKFKTGYGKFSEVADAGYDPIKAAIDNPREDLIFVFIYHTTELDAEGNKRRILTSGGKLVDNHINLDGLFTTELFTYVKPNTESGEVEYFFQTRDGIESVAKSAPGLFAEKFIPNDLQAVLDRMREYFHI